MKTNQVKNLFLKGALALSLIVSPLLTGCGDNASQQIVTNIEVSSYTQDGDIFAEFAADLDFGAVSLPTVYYPVMHPQTGEHLGTVSLTTNFDGSNAVDLDINISNIAGLQGSSQPTLPNGHPLPVGGLNGVSVVQLPVQGTLAQVYVALGENVAMAGVAIPITQLDSIGGSLGGIDFFPSFHINNVKGIAGIFTGSGTGQNGIALFVDLGDVINPMDITGSVQTLNSSRFAMSLRRSAPVMDSSIFFIDQEPSSRKMRKLKRALYRLHKDEAELTVK